MGRPRKYSTERTQQHTGFLMDTELKKILYEYMRVKGFRGLTSTIQYILKEELLSIPTQRILERDWTDQIIKGREPEIIDFDELRKEL